MPTNPQISKERTHTVLDAEDVVLGRLATEAAKRLRGKAKISFELNRDCGDWVTVINAQKVKVTGQKLSQKLYRTHSGYPGHLKELPLKALLATNPERVITEAVRGMLPKNRLRSGWLRRLKVYAGQAN